MKKMICKIFGCNFLYNFRDIPDKCICKRCSSKFELNLKSLSWGPVDKFNSSLGTDEELKKRWHP